MKKSMIPLFTVFSVQTAVAQEDPFAHVVMWPGDVTIPDNDPSGFASTQTVDLPFDQIAGMVVTLEFDGGWNGDLFAYLAHDGAMTVLMNRIGRRDTVPAGQGGPAGGMLVTFADSASTDIHDAVSGDGSGYVSGDYQPDGREADPGTVTASSPRTAFLNAFTGKNPNGQWTLYVADLGAGGHLPFSLMGAGHSTCAGAILRFFGGRRRFASAGPEKSDRAEKSRRPEGRRLRRGKDRTGMGWDELHPAGRSPA